MRHIFIIGSKGIPSSYGGFETFVDKLTEYHQSNTKLKYHVACKSNVQGEFEYNNANCFKINIPNIGAAQAIFYDLKALIYCCKYINKYKISNPIIYILACRIGPFIPYFKNRINRMGGLLYVNPDGLEWKRAKWNFLVQRYWKHSERLMVKHSDLIVCDSKNIELYILKEYQRYNPNTLFIPYGSEYINSSMSEIDEQYNDWLVRNKLSINNYYLMVGRFVPENNYEVIIREFMMSNTKRNLAVVTNVDDKYFSKLNRKTNLEADTRVKFVGTVYNKALLKKIRENAYGYIHGHEVGGTNPSLLEALGSTKLNLLLDVGFNVEVALDSAVYWDKSNGSLKEKIDFVEHLSQNQISEMGAKAIKRIKEEYNWAIIANAYEKLFLER